VSSKYEFIDGEKANYPITKMCLWAGVSKSGFYDWRNRPLSATAERREELAVDVRKIFDRIRWTYGHRRVHAQLGREEVAAGLELVRGSWSRVTWLPASPGHTGERPTLTGRRARRLWSTGTSPPGAGREARRGHHLHPHLGRAGCIWRR
jgi:hypothetical protein